MIKREKSLFRKFWIFETVLIGIEIFLSSQVRKEVNQARSQLVKTQKKNSEAPSNFILYSNRDFMQDINEKCMKLKE